MAVALQPLPVVDGTGLELIPDRCACAQAEWVGGTLEQLAFLPYSPIMQIMRLTRIT